MVENDINIKYCVLNVKSEDEKEVDLSETFSEYDGSWNHSAWDWRPIEVETISEYDFPNKLWTHLQWRTGKRYAEEGHDKAAEAHLEDAKQRNGQYIEEISKMLENEDLDSEQKDEISRKRAVAKQFGEVIEDELQKL